MTVYEICALAVLCACLCMLLKTAGSKMALALPLCGGLLLTAFALSRYREPIAALVELAEQAGIQSSVAALLKMMAVGFLSAIAADICRDMGEGSLAARVEFCGRAEILLLCLPFLLELVKLALEVAL